MMNALPDGLVKWHRFVREQDMQALAEALADDIVFRSPVLWKPKEGKATVMLYLSSAARVLEDFTYHRQIVDFEVMVRPASGLQALGSAMAQQLVSADPPKIES